MYYLEFQPSDDSWVRVGCRRFGTRERAQKEARRRFNLSGLKYRVRKEAR